MTEIEYLSGGGGGDTLALLLFVGVSVVRLLAILSVVCINVSVSHYMCWYVCFHVHFNNCFFVFNLISLL